MYVDSLSVELIASSRARDDVSSWTQKAKNLSRLAINACAANREKRGCSVLISRWGFTKKITMPHTRCTGNEAVSFLGNLVRFKTCNHDLRNSLKNTFV